MVAVLPFLKWFAFSKTGRYVLAGIGAFIGLWMLYAYVKGVGYAECKVEWQRAEQSAIEKGSDAREGAERDVAAEPPRVRDNDRHNRDNH